MGCRRLLPLPTADTRKSVRRCRPGINTRAESNNPAQAGSNGAPEPASNVARVPLCPAMAGTAIVARTLQETGNRFCPGPLIWGYTRVALRCDSTDRRSRRLPHGYGNVVDCVHLVTLRIPRGALGLDVAGEVGRAGTQPGRTRRRVPVMLEPRPREWPCLGRDPRLLPRGAAIDADLDPRNPAATRPGESGDLLRSDAQHGAGDG
jgi:hypothetical protein